MNKNQSQMDCRLLCRKQNNEELKSRLMKVKEENGKSGLKFNFQKTKIVASDPITSWQIEGENWKQ